MKDMRVGDLKTIVKEVLYGESKYSGTEKEQMFNELL